LAPELIHGFICLMEEDKSSLIDYYRAQHDWLSERFSWNQQHTSERLLDLSGFIASISSQLEPEFHDPKDHSVPLGFFEVEQPSRIRYAHLIFIFTIFERRIRTLCRVVCESDSDVTCRLSDLRGTLFDRLKEFCGKFAKISLPDANLSGQFARTSENSRLHRSLWWLRP